MAGPVHGSIEHLFLGSGQTTGSNQTVFVNIYNFLNNNTGTLGLQRIAYHTGSKNTGMTDPRGMGFYDAANPAGDNAWACFCFSSASLPYYLLLQWTGVANNFGSAPGSPGLWKSFANTNVVGFAIAQRADGGNPWNGSSGSNGIDTKGTPVWHPGASSLFLSPRSNDSIRAGATGTNRQNALGLTNASSTDYRLSMVADYDNFVILMDRNNAGTYSYCFIGSYTPLSGVSPTSTLFVFNDDRTNQLPIVVGSVYGDLAGNLSNQGSIAYPNIPLSGTCMVGLDRYTTTTGFFQNTNAQPNRAFALPTFDEFPFLVGCFETPNQVGACGQSVNFIREAYNVALHDTNSDGTRAAFGTTTVASVKITIPWSSSTVPGSGVTRTGIQF